jgi:hypothetical protein
VKGAAHYAEAERLLKASGEAWEQSQQGDLPGFARQSVWLRETAALHAQLALAAATHEVGWATLPAGDLGHESDLMRAWAQVTS